jgi:Spx/MgsR family transcriptional regulator
MALRVYQYDKCQTCRKALAWLRARGEAFEAVPIVERPPSLAELREMLRRVGELKRLFNASGELYRELKVSEKLKTMGAAEALALLARHGKLIKRPFLLAPKAGLLGFKEAEWAAAFRRP